VTDLSPRDFRVFEDRVAQPIDSVELELPRIRDMQDNVSHHMEGSFTPRGIWASPDFVAAVGHGAKPLTLADLPYFSRATGIFG
jgi:hypothetical protein